MCFLECKGLAFVHNLDDLPDNEVIISSPNYPQNYTKRSSSFWNMETREPGARIQVTLLDFQVEA